MLLASKTAFFLCIISVYWVTKHSHGLNCRREFTQVLTEITVAAVEIVARSEAVISSLKKVFDMINDVFSTLLCFYMTQLNL